MIEEVIKNVRDSFLNEGVDEQVLQELKQVRERLMRQSKQDKSSNYRLPVDVKQRPSRQRHDSSFTRVVHECAKTCDAHKY